MSFLLLEETNQSDHGPESSSIGCCRGSITSTPTFATAPLAASLALGRPQPDSIGAMKDLLTPLLKWAACPWLCLLFRHNPKHSCNQHPHDPHDRARGPCMPSHHAPSPVDDSVPFCAVLPLDLCSKVLTSEQLLVFLSISSSRKSSLLFPPFHYFLESVV